jgi:hypothetical protein
MTSSRQDLIAALAQIQNHPAHSHHDILTIHGCAPLSTEGELRTAIEMNMTTIIPWSNYGGNKRRIAKSRKPLPALAPKNEILIHLGEQGWLATFQGPHAAEIDELFGDVTLPTPFTARAPLAAVIAEVQSKNPGVIVRHWNS